MLNQDDLQKIGKIVDQTITARLEPIEKEQKKQGKTLKRIDKTLDVAIRNLNREDVRLHWRVKAIEDKLMLADKE
jgi:hypothetical protein